jgi:hypothetical protein
MCSPCYTLDEIRELFQFAESIEPSIARIAMIAKNYVCVNAVSQCSIPAIFGNTGNFGNYPCLCLCFEFSQITRTTPLRCTILHLSQIFLTDARTFIVSRFLGFL